VSFRAATDDEPWNQEPKNTFRKKESGDDKTCNLSILREALSDDSRKHDSIMEWFGIEARGRCRSAGRVEKELQIGTPELI
jgi:hypothetical protein